MSLYQDLHTTLRKAVNNTVLDYSGVTLPMYWALDHWPERGAYVVATEETTDPNASELGGSPPQSLTGFLQLMIKLPRSDAALDSQLRSLAGQVWEQFPISDYQDGDIKMVINNVSAGPHLTVGGYASVTVRVNFMAMYCIQ